MHFRTIIVLLVFTLLSTVFSIPVTSPERRSDLLLGSKRKSGNDGAFLSVARDIGTLSPDFVQRDVLEQFERSSANPAPSKAKLAQSKAKLARQAAARKAKLAANKQKRKGNGTSDEDRKKGRAQQEENKRSKARDKKELKRYAEAKAIAAGRKPGPKQPKTAVITFDTEARKEMDNLGLHGKARKRVKNYHKAVLKQDMRRHGAATGTIMHIAHSGGSDPNERFHITAEYKGHKGEQIHSNYLVDGNPSPKFHVYPEDQERRHPIPSKIRQNGAVTK